MRTPIPKSSSNVSAASHLRANIVRSEASLLASMQQVISTSESTVELKQAAGAYLEHFSAGEAAARTATLTAFRGQMKKLQKLAGSKNSPKGAAEAVRQLESWYQKAIQYVSDAEGLAVLLLAEEEFVSCAVRFVENPGNPKDMRQLVSGMLAQISTDATKVSLTATLPASRAGIAGQIAELLGTQSKAARTRRQSIAEALGAQSPTDPPTGAQDASSTVPSAATGTSVDSDAQNSVAQMILKRATDMYHQNMQRDKCHLPEGFTVKRRQSGAVEPRAQTAPSPVSSPKRAVPQSPTLDVRSATPLELPQLGQRARTSGGIGFTAAGSAFGDEAPVSTADILQERARQLQMSPVESSIDDDPDLNGAGRERDHRRAVYRMVAEGGMDDPSSHTLRPHTSPMAPLVSGASPIARKRVPHTMKAATYSRHGAQSQPRRPSFNTTKSRSPTAASPQAPQVRPGSPPPLEFFPQDPSPAVRITPVEIQAPWLPPPRNLAGPYPVRRAEGTLSASTPSVSTGPPSLYSRPSSPMGPLSISIVQPAADAERVPLQSGQIGLRLPDLDLRLFRC
eukprot:NODE_485_length_2044_cov_9.802005_g383_i0.p1 GENE.NODE_485_length_2044_cov_9.802005_g383_i0~~NODE_485_length_2044_cov_9.802005_g383_i0.p1  ORF type:complete len:646 (-),score=117.77 NODE_485_length_2044_cov_9.802005_g383_i0:107-1807(-)